MSEIEVKLNSFYKILQNVAEIIKLIDTDLDNRDQASMITKIKYSKSLIILCNSIPILLFYSDIFQESATIIRTSLKTDIILKQMDKTFETQWLGRIVTFLNLSFLQMKFEDQDTCVIYMNYVNQAINNSLKAKTLNKSEQDFCISAQVICAQCLYRMQNQTESKSFLGKALECIRINSDGSQGFKDIEALASFMLVVIELIEVKNQRQAMTNIDIIHKQLDESPNHFLASHLSLVKKIWKFQTTLNSKLSGEYILTDIKFDSKLMLRVQNMKEFKSTSIVEPVSDDPLLKSKFEKIIIEKCLLPYAKPVGKSIAADELKMMSMSKQIFDSRVVEMLIDIEKRTNDFYKNQFSLLASNRIREKISKNSTKKVDASRKVVNTKTPVKVANTSFQDQINFSKNNNNLQTIPEDKEIESVKSTNNSIYSENSNVSKKSHISISSYVNKNSCYSDYEGSNSRMASSKDSRNTSEQDQGNAPNHNIMSNHNISELSQVSLEEMHDQLFKGNLAHDKSKPKYGRDHISNLYKQPQIQETLNYQEQMGTFTKNKQENLKNIKNFLSNQSNSNDTTREKSSKATQSNAHTEKHSENISDKLSQASSDKFSNLSDKKMVSTTTQTSQTNPVFIDIMQPTSNQQSNASLSAKKRYRHLLSKYDPVTKNIQDKYHPKNIIEKNMNNILHMEMKRANLSGRLKSEPKSNARLNTNKDMSQEGGVRNVQRVNQNKLLKPIQPLNSKGMNNSLLLQNEQNRLSGKELDYDEINQNDQSELKRDSIELDDKK